MVSINLKFRTFLNIIFLSGQVIVLWACEHSPPVDSRWPAAPEGKSFVLLKDHELKMTNRLKPFDEIKYDAILSLDNDVTLHQEEIDFSFSVWQAFPHRIVGFPSRVNFCKIFTKDHN